MMIENTWENDKRSLKKHFRDISEKYGSVKGMCLDRYLSLRSAFNPSIQEILDICGLLRQVFTSFVSGVQLLVIDEFVMAYQPRKKVKIAAEIQGEPISVVFIPRKPHPNGLEIFLATTPVDHPSSTQEHLPFILDIIPHLKYGDNAPTDIVRSFMKNWIADTKPEILADLVLNLLIF
jgi:hypothetical protein